LYVKESCGYEKIKKWTSVQSKVKKEKEKKREEKIAHVFLQLFLSSKERNFPGT
jgi:hypothetical protein